MRRSAIVTGLSVLAFLVCKSETVAQSGNAEPWLITPGHAIGPIHIRMPRAEVRVALGDPNEVQTEDVWIYNREGLVIRYPIDGDAYLLLLELDETRAINPHARTSTGIGLGSSRDAVISEFGAPPTHRVSESGNTEFLRYPSVGIGFDLQEGRVIRLRVFRADSPRTQKPAA